MYFKVITLLPLINIKYYKNHQCIKNFIEFIFEEKINEGKTVL